jgi:uncharacterized protein (TIGR02246 family)
MSAEITPADRTAVESIVGGLQSAWNAMDGVAFGAPFAADADFVTIRAEHYVGRPAIAAGHQAIFNTIYAGSTTRLAVESVRLLRTDVALVHVESLLTAPHGPLAGKHIARFSMVLTKEAGGWEIAAFHNTVQPQQAPR